MHADDLRRTSGRSRDRRDDVLLARIASGGAAACISRKIRCFSSIDSGTASTTRPASVTPAARVEACDSIAVAVSFAAGVSFPFSTIIARARAIASMPFDSAPGSASTSTTR
jgi:hypothetical protein